METLREDTISGVVLVPENRTQNAPVKRESNALNLAATRKAKLKNQPSLNLGESAPRTPRLLFEASSGFWSTCYGGGGGGGG